MKYCQHYRCQVASLADAVRLATALNRRDILRHTAEAALAMPDLQVRCRLYPGALTADGLPSAPLENCT